MSKHFSKEDGMQKRDLEKWYRLDYCLKAVERNGDALQYVKEQTKAVCLKAVEQDGLALQYVKEQTEAVCLKAVEENGDALQYVNREFWPLFEKLFEK